MCRGTITTIIVESNLLRLSSQLPNFGINWVFLLHAFILQVYLQTLLIFSVETFGVRDVMD